MDEIKVKQLGNCMATDTGAWNNPTVGRVYDDSGLCPSLTRMDGGGRQPMVVDKKIVHVRQATIGGGNTGNITRNCRFVVSDEQDEKRTSDRRRTSESNSDNGEYP